MKSLTLEQVLEYITYGYILCVEIDENPCFIKCDNGTLIPTKPKIKKYYTLRQKGASVGFRINCKLATKLIKLGHTVTKVSPVYCLGEIK